MSDPTHVYTGWLLDPAGREPLLVRFPPRYPVVVAHHVTLKFGDTTAAAPTETVGQIVGEADDGAGLQALVVEIHGSTARPGGGTFHITWSLAEGREARESNAVIEQGWIALAEPVDVQLLPKP